MKKFITPLLFIGFNLFLLNSCVENSSAYKKLKAQYDSIAIIDEGLELDLAYTDSLVASVLINFQDIESVENMITRTPRRGDIRQSDRERIKDNMLLIKDKLKANRVALDELTQKLQNYGLQNKAMHQTIKALEQNLENQQTRMNALEDDLRKKNIIIGKLDKIVDNLHSNIRYLNRKAARQRRAIAEQERILNTIRYCIGTRQDLKDMHILKEGEVSTENLNEEYFTKADLRKLTEILTYSKEIKILTFHPKSAYTIDNDNKGFKVIHIKDTRKFWKSSRDLIIQVD